MLDAGDRPITQNSALRAKRTLIGISLLLSLLGIGNYLFGKIKQDSYKLEITRFVETSRAREQQSSSLSIDIDQEPSDHSIERAPHPKDPFLTIDSSEESRRILDRLESRLNFYTFVALGGQVLVASAGVIILCSLVLFRESQNASDE